MNLSGRFVLGITLAHPKRAESPVTRPGFFLRKQIGLYARPACLLQQFHLIQIFPAHRFMPSKVTVSRGRLIDRSTQVEILDYCIGAWPEIESDRFSSFPIFSGYSCWCRTSRPSTTTARHADGIRHLKSPTDRPQPAGRDSSPH